MRFKGLSQLQVWATTLSLFLLLGSCSNTDCPLNNVVRAYYTLYSSSSNSSLSLPDTLTITANNITLLNKAVRISTFSLPVSYALNQDTLLFRFSNTNATATDTIVVHHTNQPHFVSLDCGTAIFHDITEISWTPRTATDNALYIIDSIIVIRNEVNYDQTENFRIYLSGD